MTSVLLELNRITVSFDGFLALRYLNLSLQPGELRAVIGPNGACKTTFLDVITGKVAPSEGDVLFKGRSLLGRPEHRICCCKYLAAQVGTLRHVAAGYTRDKRPQRLRSDW